MRERIYIILVCVVLASCSTTRRLGESDTLYTGVKKMRIEGVDLPSAIESAVKDPLSVKPNNPLYSPYIRTPLPVGLWAWNAFYTTRHTGFRAWMMRNFGKKPVLISDVNAVFEPGTLTALVGRNGTGKSTLMRVMAGLMKPLVGEVLIDGASTATMAPRKLASTIGFVSTERVRVTNLRVKDVVALGRTPYTDWIGNLTEADRVAVDESLALVGMGSFAAAAMDTLSDGEAQKVMIARVLAQDTPVILLDEPTAFLDFYARREVCELLARLAHRRDKTVVFSSHDLALVAEFADRQLEIADGSAKIVPL